MEQSLHLSHVLREHIFVRRVSLTYLYFKTFAAFSLPRLKCIEMDTG